MHSGLRRAAAGLLLLATACSAAKDPLDELTVGEKCRVVRVFDGDALVLETGQSVRLVGVEAPAAPYRDRQGEAGFEEAKRMLEDMVLGREVELRYGGLTRDRYDRALAHVVTTDALGPRLWADGVWPIHDAAKLPADAERFQMVEGTANGMTGSDDRFTVCDVALKGSALVLAIDQSAAELCQIPDGTRLRARGSLRDGRLEASHPLNLEVLD